MACLTRFSFIDPRRRRRGKYRKRIARKWEWDQCAMKGEMIKMSLIPSLLSLSYTFLEPI
jgi:hypothetical protein